MPLKFLKFLFEDLHEGGRAPLGVSVGSGATESWTPPPSATKSRVCGSG